MSIRTTLLLLLALASPAWAISPQDKLAENLDGAFERGPVRVIVELDVGSEEEYPDGPIRRGRYNEVRAQVLSELFSDDYDKARGFSHLPMMGLRLKNRNALDKLLQNPNVSTVYPDKPHKAVTSQSLPLIGQPAVANVMGRSGSNTTVAVLDTGGLYTRPELGSCTAVGVPASCKVVAAQDFAYPDDILDDSGSGVEGIGHGTEVAATVAVVAPATKFALLDVFDGEDAWSVDIIDAINWSIANRNNYGIAAINMSLGDGVRNTAACNSTTGPGANPFVTPIANARTAGMVVVIASGNEGYADGLASPACVSQSVSVGAVYDANIGSINFGFCSDSTTAADKVTCYSNSAGFLDMLAPGSAITVVGNTTHGTSFAAPMVAGAVAVLKSAFPGETPAQIEARLINNGKPVADTRNSLVKPRLNLLAAQGAPANDAFAASVALSGAGIQTTGWNYNATAESGEPSHAGQVGGRSVWWNWVAPGNGTLVLSTQGSGVDTLLAVYTGTAVNALTQIAANDNGAGLGGGASSLNTTVTAGTTYRIAIDGKAGVAGALALDMAFTAAAPSADVSVTLTDAQDPINAGQQLAYALQVSNTGPDTAQNVSVTLNYPAGWVLSGGTCTDNGGQTAVCIVGNLASGASASFNPMFTTAAQAGTFQMVATVSSDTADPVSANNSAIADTTLNGPVVNPTSEGDAPTLTEWAAMLMAMTLFAMIARRRMEE